MAATRASMIALMAHLAAAVGNTALGCNAGTPGMRAIAFVDFGA